MSLPLDEAQEWRHSTRNLAQLAAILSAAIKSQGIEGQLHDDMVLAWWRPLIASTFAPDLAGMFGKLLGGAEE